MSFTLNGGNALTEYKNNSNFTDFHVRATYAISSVRAERNCFQFVSITTQHRLQLSTQLRLFATTSSTNNNNAK